MVFESSMTMTFSPVKPPFFAVSSTHYPLPAEFLSKATAGHRCRPGAPNHVRSASGRPPFGSGLCTAMETIAVL